MRTFGMGWIVAAVVLGAGGCEADRGEGRWGEDDEDGEEGTTATGAGACSTGRFVHVEEGPTMKPGGDCVTCHASGEGPNYELAGTVMNDYADATGCEGISDVTVRITDVNGEVHTLQTNSAGNFYTRTAISGPYTVELEYMGDTRAMVTPQTTGDCASCHTADGANGAPGRIIAP